VCHVRDEGGRGASTTQHSLTEHSLAQHTAKHAVECCVDGSADERVCAPPPMTACLRGPPKVHANNLKRGMSSDPYLPLINHFRTHTHATYSRQVWEA
jgi:hypothetical protein